MQMKVYIIIIIIQLICLYNLFVISRAKALVGENVRQANEGEFPFIVSIGHSLNNHEVYKHFCTGALVSNRDVLTAEHCMENKLSPFVRISIGSRDIREGAKYSLSWWISYDEWIEYHNLKQIYEVNDIAIIRLQSNVSDTEPGIISNLQVNTLTGESVLVGAWGRRADNSRPIIMEAANLTILDIKECKRRVLEVSGKSLKFQSSVFCSYAEPYALVQKGDSGGPVVYMNEIIGVTQGTCPFPELYIHPDKINVHFTIYHYRIFIHDTIRNL